MKKWTQNKNDLKIKWKAIKKIILGCDRIFYTRPVIR